MTEVHSCGSPPFSTCLGAVASFIISQGQKCHKKPFPLVYHQSHKEKSVKGGHRPQRLPLILFFVGYNAGGENGCPSVPLLPPVLHCEPETVKEEMQATKELWGKTDGRTYKHYVQSYHEDEKITPEQAHKNAVELAEHTKAWKGQKLCAGYCPCGAGL